MKVTTLMENTACADRYAAVYYTGHCAGVAQYEFLKQKMGNQSSQY